MLMMKVADGKIFEVEEKVAMESKIIRNYLEDEGFSKDTVIPLPDVTGEIFTRILSYYRSIGETADIKGFGKEFVKDLDNKTLLELIRVSHYLEMKDLLEMLYEAAAEAIKDLSVQECRDFFNIENDYTPEEEAELRAQFAWAFE